MKVHRISEKKPIAVDAAKKQLVLRKALLRAAEAYHVSRSELCAMLGMSEASASRLYAETRSIDPNSKEGELALLFLRLYRSLSALLGGNEEQARLWLRSDHEYFQMKPIELMQHVQGLVDVVNYCDAMRGKV
ncbi:MAG: DUF2384 domain-containing protein [Proteobacteria bacterium]|nr:DUF2384 domain-containing protein [Pseudomonadota bacterium]